MTDVRRMVRQLYDEEALGYAANTDSYSDFPGLKEDVDSFAAQLERPARILDLGSGPGRDSKYLAARGFSVVAADFSLEMLRIGRSAEAAQVQADMVQLPFRSNTFAGAWVCASLLHLPSYNHDQALIELLRVLAPGGLVAVSMKAQYNIAPHELELRSGDMPTDAADYAGLAAAVGGWWQDLTWLKEVLRVLGHISGDGRHVLNSVDRYVCELREEER